MRGIVPQELRLKNALRSPVKVEDNYLTFKEVISKHIWLNQIFFATFIAWQVQISHWFYNNS